MGQPPHNKIYKIINSCIIFSISEEDFDMQEYFSILLEPVQLINNVSTLLENYSVCSETLFILDKCKANEVSLVMQKVSSTCLTKSVWFIIGYNYRDTTKYFMKQNNSDSVPRKFGLRVLLFYSIVDTISDQRNINVTQILGTSHETVAFEVFY